VVLSAVLQEAVKPLVVQTMTLFRSCNKKKKAFAIQLNIHIVELKIIIEVYIIYSKYK
jgi:hypothetical protein